MGSRFIWITKFPYIVGRTLHLKIKNRRLDESEYHLHQKEFFGQDFHDNSDKFHRQRRRIARLAIQASNGSALDLATGAGWQAMALKKEGFNEVIGIDLVPQRIEHASKLHKSEGLSFIPMDGSRMNFPDKRFDCSTVSAALHDMPPSVVRACLKELQRVTKHRIIIFEPKNFKNPIVASVYGGLGELLDESLHFMEYVKTDMDSLVRECGLRIVKKEKAWHNLMQILVLEPVS